MVTPDGRNRVGCQELFVCMCLFDTSCPLRTCPVYALYSQAFVLIYVWSSVCGIVALGLNSAFHSAASTS